MKHFVQAKASGIIIILTILHINIRRFNIKYLAQCHLTKEHQPNTISRNLCYFTSRTVFHLQNMWLTKCIRERLILLFLRIQLVPNNASEAVAVMQRGLFIPNYLGFRSPTHSPTLGRKTWKHRYCLVWNLPCPHWVWNYNQLSQGAFKTLDQYWKSLSLKIISVHGNWY